MECNIKHRLSIKRPKVNFAPGYEFDEVVGYLHNEDSLFAICKLDEWNPHKWWIVHRPSEEPFASFENKKYAEIFLGLFLDIIDEGDIQYLTPAYSQVDDQFRAAYRLVHPRFWKTKRSQ